MLLSSLAMLYLMAQVAFCDCHIFDQLLKYAAFVSLVGLWSIVGLVGLCLYRWLCLCLYRWLCLCFYLWLCQVYLWSDPWVVSFETTFSYTSAVELVLGDRGLGYKRGTHQVRRKPFWLSGSPLTRLLFWTYPRRHWFLDVSLRVWGALRGLCDLRSACARPCCNSLGFGTTWLHSIQS